MAAHGFKRYGRQQIGESPEVIEEFLEDEFNGDDPPPFDGRIRRTFPQTKKSKLSTVDSNKKALATAVPTSSGLKGGVRNVFGGGNTTTETRVTLSRSVATNDRGNPVFMTASVSTIRQWNRYRDEIPMLVELFGTMDKLSRPMIGPSSCVKVFNLQDLTPNGGSILCRFYEIDRPIPELDTDQYVRCVGRLDRDGCLLCVSIRNATKQEIQWRTKLMGISAKAMYHRMTSLTEN